MIVDTIESYLNLDDLDSPTTRSEAEEKIESSVSEIQSKHNQIQERFIALKAITETLREQILNEKELWEKELKETIDLEKQLRERPDCGSGDKLTVVTNNTDFKGYVYKEVGYFTHTYKYLENYSVSRNDYQQTLFDVETKCNMELLKIQHSITILKPLKEMAAKWTRRGPLESTDQVHSSRDAFSEEEDTVKEEGVQSKGNYSGGRSDVPQVPSEDESGAGGSEDKENELS